MARITYRQLKRLGACEEALALFAMYWGESVEVTPEACAEAAALGLDTAWAADYLLSPRQAREKYWAIRQPAWEQYKAIQEPAWEQYKAIEQQAWEQYNAIEQPAWEKYEADCWQAFGEAINS